MLIAILVLSIFNTGLIFILGLSIFGAQQDIAKKAIALINHNTDSDVETALTAIYNMDSLKQKVEVSGEAEIP